MSASDLFPCVTICECAVACRARALEVSPSFLLKSSLLALVRDVSWKPPDTRRSQLHILWAGGARAVAMGELRRLLWVVLSGVTTMVIRILLLLVLLASSLVVVVNHCSRVVQLIVGRIVGLMAAVGQGLDWGGGNIQGQLMVLEQCKIT